MYKDSTPQNVIFYGSTNIYIYLISKMSKNNYIKLKKNSIK